MAYGRSVFPESLDSFVELLDLNASQRANANRYKELKAKETLTTAEQEELNGLMVTLQNYIITPETWNKTNDCIVAMERFITDTWKEYYKYTGDYDNTKLYKAYNSVKYTDGNIYMALEDVQGVVPTDNTKWLLLSKKGDKGTIWTGNYSELASYKIDDLVYYQGSTYICIQNTTAGILPTNTYYFSLFSKKGDNGTNLPYRGQYSASENYIVDDLVTRLGSVYRCKQNNMGVLPESDTTETYWEVFMSGSGENLADLQTENRTSIVNAINEVVNKIGLLPNLLTTAKNNIVNAINELFNKIGNLSNLTTTEKTNLVGAVSEVKDEITSHLADLEKHGVYTDTSTGKKYVLGVLNGLLYFKEVI